MMGHLGFLPVESLRPNQTLYSAPRTHKVLGPFSNESFRVSQADGVEPSKCTSLDVFACSLVPVPRSG